MTTKKVSGAKVKEIGLYIPQLSSLLRRQSPSERLATSVRFILRVRGTSRDTVNRRGTQISCGLLLSFGETELLFSEKT